MPQMTYTETLIVTSCWCGINLAIPADLHRYAHQKKNHAIFCPLGHEFIFSNTTEEKLQREREKSARLTSQLDQERARLAAQKGVATKLRKKVARAEHGVCPHCNRTFQNLLRHVKTKHPECVA